MSEISLTLVLQIKTSKIINGMVQRYKLNLRKSLLLEENCKIYITFSFSFTGNLMSPCDNFAISYMQPNLASRSFPRQPHSTLRHRKIFRCEPNFRPIFSFPGSLMPPCGIEGFSDVQEIVPCVLISKRVEK